MSLVLNLPPELETRLSAEAAQMKLPLDKYILRILASGRIGDAMPTDGAQLVAYWQNAGLVGSRTEIADAPAHARALRERAQKRKRS